MSEFRFLTYFGGRRSLLRAAWKGWWEGRIGLPEGIPAVPDGGAPSNTRDAEPFCDERCYLSEVRAAAAADQHTNLQRYRHEMGEIQLRREMNEADERNAASKLVEIEGRYQGRQPGSRLPAWGQWFLLLLLALVEIPVNYAAIEQLRVERWMGWTMATSFGAAVLYAVHTAGIFHQYPKDPRQKTERYAEWTLLALAALFTLSLAALRHSAFTQNPHVGSRGTWFFLLGQGLLLGTTFWLAYGSHDPVQAQRNRCTRLEKETRAIIVRMQTLQLEARAAAGALIHWYGIRRSAYISLNARSRRKRSPERERVRYLPLALTVPGDYAEPIQEYVSPRRFAVLDNGAAARPAGDRVMRGVVLSLILLFPWVGSGCTGQDRPSPGRTADYVLVDGTKSTTALPVRLNYYRGMQLLFRRAEPEQIFVGDAITSDSLATSRYALSGIFPARDSQTTDPMWTDAVEPVLDSLERQARELLQLEEQNGALTLASAALAGEGPRGTALLDAFWGPARFFSEGEGRKATRKRIWVFSDAIEQSRRWDFVGEDLTSERIQQIVTTEKAAGHLPDLTGVEVYFVGAGWVPADLLEQGRVQTLTGRQLQQIREFWCAWAVATQAQIPPDGYVPALRDWTPPETGELAVEANGTAPAR